MHAYVCCADEEPAARSGGLAFTRSGKLVAAEETVKGGHRGAALLCTARVRLFGVGLERRLPCNGLVA